MTARKGYLFSFQNFLTVFCMRDTIKTSNNETEEFSMRKKLLTAVSAVMLILTCTNTAFASTDYFAEHWGLDTERTLYFGTENGSYIKPITATIGTTISLADIIPEKYGYIFDGWFTDPRTKENRVTEFTFNENDAVYAKWIPNGLEQIAEKEIKITPLTTAEILAYGNYIDEKTGVPVTALWVAQNKRLNELMEIYNENFK